MMLSLLDSNSQGIAEWIGQVVQSGTLSRKDLLKWVADVITAVIGPEVPEVSPVVITSEEGCQDVVISVSALFLAFVLPN